MPDKLIDIDIVDQSFTETEFLIKFTVLGDTDQVITNPNIQMWWNGTDVPSSNINHLGGGLYSVSLTPITVAPGDEPILLNMTISASGYLDMYYETYIAVDPDVIEKLSEAIPSNNGGGGGGGNDKPTIPLIMLGSSIGAGVVVIIMAGKGLLTKLKRKK